MSDRKALNGNGNIPFADSDSDDADTMSPSQEHLANEYMDRLREPSLSERRNQTPKLTVVIENEINLKKKELEEENKDTPGPLIQVEEHISDDEALQKQNQRAIGLRRNSISMPTLNANDLEALRQAHMNHEANQIQIEADDRTESVNCSLNTVSDFGSLKPRITYHSDDDDDEEPVRRTLFRNKRRLSVAPLPALRLNDKEMMSNDFDSHSVMSNQASITSINSLASLLKEKMQMFPAMIKKRKKATKDYKLRVFVGMLFLIIVFLIGYAYVMYNQKVLARSYFENVKFNKITRRIRIFDSKGIDIITGSMGTTVDMENLFECLPEHLRQDGSVCWEWDNRARLYMNFEEAPVSDIRCYSFKWQSLAEGLEPTDCFDLADDKGFWYGGGLTNGVDYPLGKGSFDFAPFVTGDINTRQWGNAVKRYFINSRGVAIHIEDQTPLYVSMNYNNSGQFCLKAKNDDFSYVNKFTKHPNLNYKICTAPLQILHRGMTQKSLWDGLKEEDINVIHSLIEEPVWQIPVTGIEKLTEAAIYNYTEDVIALGFMRLGHVLISEFWQKNIGDFKLDEERFPTLEDTVTILHRRGFRISLTIQPFICTESPNFVETVRKELLISERNSDRNVPALTSYKSTASAGVLDITNNATLPWLLEKLEKVVKTYQIDSFYLDFGTAFNMPRYYQCSKLLNNPDQYKTIFTQSLEGGVSVIGVSGAISVPRPPTFLNMPPVNSSWTGLQSLIPTLLSYGIIGFPFIMPGPVGGDYVRTAYNGSYMDVTPLPDKELYIRWLQLASFLPVLRFTHLPSEYKSDFVTEVAKELTAVRQKTVTPLLKKYLSDAMNEGLPLIRPLWMLDTLDVNSLYIDDEFSVGDELIVAPILYKDTTVREVYLPQGVWKDGIDGSLRKGSRWIHHYRVPEEKVAYFVKMPDNTRF